MNKCLLSPSLMCGNLLNIDDDIEIFIEHKVDYLHIDIMDGNFVPNITFGFDFANSLSKKSIPRDIHLMVFQLEFAINKLSLNTKDIIFFHIEATKNIGKIISLISSKCKVGLAINSSTQLENVYPYLSKINFVYLMTIKKTGFSGEPFDENSYARARKICTYVTKKKLNVIVGVDGAIGIEQIKNFRAIGVRLFTLGTKAVYNGDLRRNLMNVKNICA